jgi:hypothetical protein
MDEDESCTCIDARIHVPGQNPRGAIRIAAVSLVGAIRVGVPVSEETIVAAPAAQPAAAAAEEEACFDYSSVEERERRALKELACDPEVIAQARRWPAHREAFLDDLDALRGLTWGWGSAEWVQQDC